MPLQAIIGRNCFSPLRAAFRQGMSTSYQALSCIGLVQQASALWGILATAAAAG
jgi:hypothetical protein